MTDPTVNSLRVRWDPADGDVRQYNVIYVPAAGGVESMVNSLEPSLWKTHVYKQTQEVQEASDCSDPVGALREIVIVVNACSQF